MAVRQPVRHGKRLMFAAPETKFCDQVGLHAHLLLQVQQNVSQMQHVDSQTDSAVLEGELVELNPYDEIHSWPGPIGPKVAHSLSMICSSKTLHGRHPAALTACCGELGLQN